MKNLKSDTELLKLLPSGTKINKFIGDVMPPSNSASKPMCMAYHLKGGCWATCQCIDNHREHIASEHQALLSFTQSWISILTKKWQFGKVTWHCSVPMLILATFSYLAVGTLVKCFAPHTSKLSSLSSPWHLPCFTMAPLHSFPTPF